MRKVSLLLLSLLLLATLIVGCGSTQNKDQKYLNEVDSILEDAIKDNIADYKALNSNAVPTNIMYDKSRLTTMLKQNKDGLDRLNALSKPDTDESKKIYSKAKNCLNKGQEEVKARIDAKTTDDINNAIKLMKELNLSVVDFKLMKADGK